MRLVLFDLDGTLADSAPDLVAAINACLTARAMEPRPLAQLRPWISHGARGLIEQTFGWTPDDAGYEALRVEFIERYEKDLCRATTLFPGVAAMLDRIEQSGSRWGIVTNKVSRLTDPLVAALGLSERAACVVSGDSAARPKPHPDPIDLALRLCDCLPQHAVYVGDDRRDITAGREAGVRTAAVRYGYSVSIDAIDDWGADVIVDTPAALLDWLDLSGSAAA